MSGAKGVEYARPAAPPARWSGGGYGVAGKEGAAAAAYSQDHKGGYKGGSAGDGEYMNKGGAAA